MGTHHSNFFQHSNQTPCWKVHIHQWLNEKNHSDAQRRDDAQSIIYSVAEIGRQIEISVTVENNFWRNIKYKYEQGLI